MDCTGLWSCPGACTGYVRGVLWRALSRHRRGFHGGSLHFDHGVDQAYCDAVGVASPTAHLLGHTYVQGCCHISTTAGGAVSFLGSATPFFLNCCFYAPSPLRVLGLTGGFRWEDIKNCVVSAVEFFASVVFTSCMTVQVLFIFFENGYVQGQRARWLRGRYPGRCGHPG